MVRGVGRWRWKPPSERSERAPRLLRRLDSPGLSSLALRSPGAIEASWTALGAASFGRLGRVVEPKSFGAKLSLSGSIMLGKATKSKL